MCILSGLIILYVPVQLYEVSAVPGNMLVVGFFLGGLTLLLGVLAYLMPKLSTLLGVLAIFSAVLSVFGALGGFLIGTILGIIGGSIAIAWKPTYAPHSIEPDQTVQKEIASGKELLSEK
ncbi:DUF6114 domain-containing protein [Neobacillus sp. LXY-1]|uniref:DUF6114 domain-containing protein n=1 Tax=Bacillaceae TaxID=186817 RepID=UPI003EE1D4B7